MFSEFFFFQKYDSHFKVKTKQKIMFNFSRYIPESPSWLLVVGKDEEALDCLALVAKVNQQQFRVNILIIGLKVLKRQT